MMMMEYILINKQIILNTYTRDLIIIINIILEGIIQQVFYLSNLTEYQQKKKKKRAMLSKCFGISPRGSYGFILYVKNVVVHG